MYEENIPKEKPDSLSPQMWEYLKDELKEVDGLVLFKDRLAKVKFSPNKFVTFFVDFRKPFQKWNYWTGKHSDCYVLVPIYWEKQWCKIWYMDNTKFYRDLVIEALKGRTIFTMKADTGDNMWRIVDNQKDINLKSFIPDYYP